MVLVSVIIPTFNRAQQVTRAIDSVLAQSYRNYEIIVVDDGSTDDTKKVIQPYMNRICYIYQENSGVSAARNAGLRASNGDWIAFLDSDDIWLPDKLMAQIQCINHTHAKVCFTNVKFMGEKENILTSRQYVEEVFQEPFDIILQHPVVLYVQALLVKRSLVQKLGGFDERLKLAEDTRLIYNLGFESPFAFICTTLVHIDRNDSRKGLTEPSVDVRRAMCQAHLEIVSQAYFRCFGKNPKIMKKLRCMLGHFLSVRALINCVDKNYSDARISALDALHFGGGFRTYRRSAVVLLLPWLVGRMRQNVWQ